MHAGWNFDRLRLLFFSVASMPAALAFSPGGQISPVGLRMKGQMGIGIIPLICRRLRSLLNDEPV
jgi:hypothetical protein